MLLLGLSVASASYSVSEAQKAIEDIGQVTFSEESRRAIDEAAAALQALDANLKLEERVKNADDLTAAQAEYVRLAIKTAVVAEQRKVREGLTDDEIRQKIAQAREAVNAYFPEDAEAQLPTLPDLITLEIRYQNTEETDITPVATPPVIQQIVEVPLC